MQENRRCSQPDGIRCFPDPIGAEQLAHEFMRVAAPVEGRMDRKLKRHGGDRPGRGFNDHHPGDHWVDADRHPESQPHLEHEPDRHRRYQEGLDERLLRSVIRLESFGGDEIPSLIVDEALNAIGAEAVGIEQDYSEDECLLKRCLHDGNPRGLEVIGQLRGDEVEAVAWRALLEEFSGEEMLVSQRTAEMPAEGVIDLLLDLRADKACG